MRTPKPLGEFELQILLATAHLRDEAYGASIRNHLKQTINRDVSIGAIYTTLERLEKKNLVSSRMGEPTAERGGRAKKLISLSAEGKKSLCHTKTSLDKLWRGIELSDIPSIEVSAHA